MKTVKIMVEVVLKSYEVDSWCSPDFIHKAIESVLETGEQVIEYTAEVTA